jgi:hypothetical protein
MHERHLEVRRLGRFAYEAGLRLQKELEQAVIERRETDYLLLLEHPHTFTIGRRAKENGVLATAERLKSLDVSVFETNRGGKVDVSRTRADRRLSDYKFVTRPRRRSPIRPRHRRSFDSHA